MSADPRWLVNSGGLQASFHIEWKGKVAAYPLAEPGGGAHPARAPPKGRGPMIFFLI